MTGPNLLAFGDSLTAGYGLSRTDAFPAQLERLLQGTHPGAAVRNAGVSGETSIGGRARLSRLLSSLDIRPDLAIVELGANDFIRGIDPVRTEDNLDAILRELARCGIPTLLAGMAAPALLGPIAARFNALFPALAAKHRVPLYPFFLKGVIGDPALTLADGLHPNARAIGIVARNILPSVLAALGATPDRAAAG